MVNWVITMKAMQRRLARWQIFCTKNTNMTGGLPLGKIGFWCLDHDEPGHIYLRQLSLNMYCKMIPEYEPEEVAQLFHLKNGEV